MSKLEVVNCDCKHEDLWWDEIDGAKEEDNDSTVTVDITDTVEFAKVAVGKKAYKSFKIRNTTRAVQEYFVHYDPNMNPIYRTFDFSWTRIVEPGETFDCRIVYKPLFPFDVSVDYLFVKEKSAEVLTLLLRGESIGPQIELSTTETTFNAHKKKQIVERIIEVSNTGDVEALYQFDVVQSRIGLFSLNKSRGTISPRKSDFIKITFTAPQELGTYSEKLPLLILHHKPMFINLLGFYTKEKIPDDEMIFKYYNFDISKKSDYGGYLCDAMTIMKNPPPISFSKNYLNFEGVTVDSGDENSKTLVTSLTNHMSEEIEVEWHHCDKSSAFSISPKSSKIHAYDSRLFECTFCPPDADRFYHDVLSADVYWIDTRQGSSISETYVTIPIPIQLRILGHSFPPNKKWIPQLIIPDTVILPPCFADSSSNTTFLLKVKGYLPVSYRFLPPKKSQFILKPMMGVIEDSQIVIVHFSCGDNKKAFVERWGIDLNGTGTDLRSIYIKTYCERPSVKIGTNNTITFPAVQPDSQEFVTVQLFNTSVHCLKYKFQFTKEHDLLRVDYPEGRMAANEAINLEWTVIGKLSSPMTYKIICEIRALEGTATSGKPFEIPVQVFTECSYTELCSMPTKCNFRKIEVGIEHTFRFNLFNFGQSTIHYKLIFWDPRKPDFNERCMSVIPSQGTIIPKERSEILLCLHCKCSGSFDVHVYYQTRLNKDSAQIVSGDQIHQVFTFKFSSSYPCIQIVDINDHNFGPLFSKTTLWDLFTIDKINNHLKSMKRNEIRNVSIYLPESELSQELFQCVWVLKNVSSFDTRMTLKRVKLCDCPLVQMINNLTIRSLVYDCKHRELFAMVLSGEVFQTSTYQTLNMTVRYQERGITHMCYTINFSHSRSLRCNVFINTLAETVTWPSKYLSNFHMRMGTVSVDDEQPPIRAYWLYNNTSKVVSYELLMDLSEKRFYIKDFEVLNCINPEGSLLPFSTKPILFKFSPLQCKIYNFTIPIRLGEHSYQFHVTGRGTSKFRDMKYSLQLQENIQMIPSDDVQFSEEHIILRSIVIWTKCESVIFIRNLSKTQLIGYSFDPVSVPGIIEVKVLQGKGVLTPKECHMLVVQVNAFDQPCSMTVQLPCKFLDHSAYYKYKQSSLEYALRQHEIKEQFIITEQGIQYPTNEVVVEPMPKNFYRTLSLDIEVVSCNYADEILGNENLFFQFPQYLLNLDYAKIAHLLRPKELQQPITSFRALQDQAKVEAKDASIHCEKKSTSIENIEVIRDTIDSLLKYVLESDVFWRILKEKEHLPPPYYIQFKMDDSLNYQDGLKEKENYLVRSLKTMQAPLMAEIFQKIIIESVHQVFQLGSQVKSTIDLQYIYEPQFKCSHACANTTCKGNTL